MIHPDTNLSCAPTCLSLGYNSALTVKGIHPGEELTGDYAALNLRGYQKEHTRP